MFMIDPEKYWIKMYIIVIKYILKDSLPILYFILSLYLTLYM